MDTSQQVAVIPRDKGASVAAQRQRRSIAEKRRIVEETLAAGASVARVARAHGVALGRKNYLFAGSDAGGERAAAMYSLIESAKLNDLDPEDYLRQVLTCIADHPINRIEELLPWNIHVATREVST
jgi:transposase-like protein